MFLHIFLQSIVVNLQEKMIFLFPTLDYLPDLKVFLFLTTNFLLNPAITCQMATQESINLLMFKEILQNRT